MKGLENKQLLDNLLSAAELQALERRVLECGKEFDVYFKLVDIGEQALEVRVTQGRRQAEAGFTGKQLADLAKQLFAPFFPGWQIDAGAVVATNIACNVVTPAWIVLQLQKYRVRLHTISKETGIPDNVLRNILHGKGKLTQPLKAMFWYYFRVRELESSQT